MPLREEQLKGAAIFVIVQRTVIVLSCAYSARYIFREKAPQLVFWQCVIDVVVMVARRA